MPDVALPAA
jgi:hypothetical protein